MNAVSMQTARDRGTPRLGLLQVHRAVTKPKRGPKNFVKAFIEHGREMIRTRSRYVVLSFSHPEKQVLNKLSASIQVLEPGYQCISWSTKDIG